MSKTYADDTKRIVELYSYEKDRFGKTYEKRLGLREVFFLDDITGAIVDGPWLEPVPDCVRDVDGTTVTEYIVGRKYINDSQAGGELGHYKHLAY